MLTRAVPDRGLGGEFHGAGGVVIPGHGGGGPGGLGLVKDGFQRGTPRALQRWAAILTRLTGGCWCIEGGVQTQTGDEGHRLGQGLAAVQEVEDGVAVIANQHQGPMGQPAA